VAAVIVLIAAAVGGYLLFGRGDDDGVAAGGGPGVVLLEPTDARQANDFAGQLDVDPPGRNAGIALANFPRAKPSTGGLVQQGAPITFSGNQPGLYGGSRDVTVCDIEQLVSFLTDPGNRAKAEAWASVHQIDVDEIEDFIGTLTPVRLRFDTRVTNHGFSNGRATPSQSILEAGTAVLVDALGIPRVKCNCGNPLLPPAAVTADYTIQNQDDAWDTFDRDDVLAVTEAPDPVDTYTLIDTETGEVFGRPARSDGSDDTDAPGDVLDELCPDLEDSPTCNGEGGSTTTTSTTEGPGDTTTTTIELATGDVQVTVTWNSAADLDLEVADPTGESVSRLNSPTASGGVFDRDSNVGCTNDGAVENIVWPDAAPAGTYTARIIGFGVESCGESGDFVLTVTIHGETQTFTGTATESQDQTFDFQVR
jgi:hypothetical protein